MGITVNNFSIGVTAGSLVYAGMLRGINFLINFPTTATDSIYATANSMSRLERGFIFS